MQMLHKIVIGHLMFPGHLENLSTEGKHQSQGIVPVENIGTAPKVCLLLPIFYEFSLCHICCAQVVFMNINFYTSKFPGRTVGFGYTTPRLMMYHL